MKFTTAFSVSVIALVGASSAYAADVTAHVAPHAVVPAAPLTPAIEVPAFSWNGFYLGAQGGINFGKNAKINDTDVAAKADANDSSLNGLFGDIFTGYNINLGSSLVFGIETDVNLVKAAAGVVIPTKNFDVSDEYQYDDGRIDVVPKDMVKKIRKFVRRFNNTDAEKAALKNYLIDSAFSDSDAKGDPTSAVFTVKRTTTTSFEQQWSGATRARFGFAVDRFMPYLAGGVAYTSVNGKIATNDTATVARNSKTDDTKDPAPLDDDVKNTEYTATKTLNDSQILLGFTVGAGFDFAITDNVLARAEYRYNDFGSKDFTFSETNKVKYALKDQDIRVGVAFKF